MGGGNELNELAPHPHAYAHFAALCVATDGDEVNGVNYERNEPRPPHPWHSLRSCHSREVNGVSRERGEWPRVKEWRMKGMKRVPLTSLP